MAVNAGTLDLGGFSPAVGARKQRPGQPRVALGAATLTIGNGDASSTFAGVITGTGGSSGDRRRWAPPCWAAATRFTGPTTLTASGTLVLANPLALQFSTLDYGSNHGSLSFGTLTEATLGGLAGSNWYFRRQPERSHRPPAEPGEYGQRRRGPDGGQQRRQHHLHAATSPAAAG